MKKRSAVILTAIHCLLASMLHAPSDDSIVSYALINKLRIAPLVVQYKKVSEAQFVDAEKGMKNTQELYLKIAQARKLFEMQAVWAGLDLQKMEEIIAQKFLGQLTRYQEAKGLQYSVLINKPKKRMWRHNPW